MAAYGLYTHIAANRTRSMVLLAGLFLLVYVIVYAGALIIEVLNNGDATFNYYLRAALADVISPYPIPRGRHDRCRHWRRQRHAEGAAPAL